MRLLFVTSLLLLSYTSSAFYCHDQKVYGVNVKQCSERVVLSHGEGLDQINRFCSFEENKTQCPWTCYSCTISEVVFRREALRFHNLVRSMHHRPHDEILRWSWSEALAESATQRSRMLSGLSWDASLIKRYVGENVYVGYNIRTTENIPLAAINYWYKPSETYDYTSNTFKSADGFFTQLVWASSSTVGCGHSKYQEVDEISGRLTNFLVVCCHYFPPGNIMRQFRVNVRTPKKPLVRKQMPVHPLHGNL